MSDLLLLSINFLLCSSIGYISVCRLNMMGRNSDPRLRAQFVLLFVGALAHGWEPVLFSSKPSLGGATLSAVVLAALLLSFRRWRVSHPDHAGGFHA